MADELELVMGIETLEIFEVKSSDENSKDDLESPEEQVLNSKSYHTNVVQLTLFDAVNLANFEDSS
ncbi:hypothetical protein AB3329_03425 [Streptococcus sp. H31]|uniref:hypothetical protein n=1 Tax=Streptococcus huangxiaojuni TaxID=3237239 RepID=UPI0034A4AD9E